MIFARTFSLHVFSPSSFVFHLFPIFQTLLTLYFFHFFSDIFTRMPYETFFQEDRKKRDQLRAEKERAYLERRAATKTKRGKTHADYEAEWVELQREEAWAKQLKRGAISREEYEVLTGERLATAATTTGGAAAAAAAASAGASKQAVTGKKRGGGGGGRDDSDDDDGWDVEDSDGDGNDGDGGNAAANGAKKQRLTREALDTEALKSKKQMRKRKLEKKVRTHFRNVD
jgi:hypothetical protein